jgi:hypothetical protein
MRIKTKEEYMKRHQPRKPKSLERKKQRRGIIATVKSLLPTNEHTVKLIKARQLTEKDLLEACCSPSIIKGGWLYLNKGNKRGFARHSAQIRVIKKTQRRRKYLKMCRRSK